MGYDVRCRCEGSHNTSYSERVTYLGKQYSSTLFEIASFRSCAKDSKTGMRLFEGEPPMLSASFRRLAHSLTDSMIESRPEINRDKNNFV